MIIYYEINMFKSSKCWVKCVKLSISCHSDFELSIFRKPISDSFPFFGLFQTNKCLSSAFQLKLGHWSWVKLTILWKFFHKLNVPTFQNSDFNITCQCSFRSLLFLYLLFFSLLLFCLCLNFYIFRLFCLFGWLLVFLKAF